MLQEKKLKCAGVDKGDLIGTINKAKKELDYVPQISIKTGLEITYESLVSNKS